MIDWQQYVVIAAEAVLALVATISSVVSYIRRLHANKHNQALTSVLLCVPRAVLEAELRFGDGAGDEKRLFAETLMRQYAEIYGLDYSKYQALIVESIEDVLATPQKKF